MRSIAILSRVFVLALAALVVAPASTRGAPPTPEALRARKLAARRFAGMAVSLPQSAFAHGLRVCARETPSGIIGYWKVPRKAMERIDAELFLHLRKSGLDKGLPFSAKLYVRQYAGYVRDGMRFVYVNALLVEKGSRAAREAQKRFPRSCEAVKGSWGIQYDTQTKKFMGFSSK
ncbi:MAG: hypothetical protein JXP73_13265 [Deltaproteobacteria bacterium]|nr:hypothetical protein [Deltaproteobacteria bacterium]